VPLRRRASRLTIARRKRAARKAEEFILGYEFPPHIGRRVRRKHAGLDDRDWALIERGLREWFICCAWRGRTGLGMPSRAVDEAWHEFILDTLAYETFCGAAFGAYLHHTPDEAMSTSMGDALANTIRAWDHSDVGDEEESVLWDLDERLGIDEPLGIDGLQLSAVRSASVATGTGIYGVGGCAVGAGGCSGGGGGDSSGCSGGGCGGGCGGGGCGGGGS
jgi:hypothetical protein